MMPKMSVSPEATSARIIPFTRPFRSWTATCSSTLSGPRRRAPPPAGAAPRQRARAGPAPPDARAGGSNAEVAVDHRVARAELGGRRHVAHGALLHDVDAIADVEGERHVLLDEQNGHPLLVKRVDDRPDLRDHPRHQS